MKTATCIVPPLDPGEASDEIEVEEPDATVGAGIVASLNSGAPEGVVLGQVDALDGRISVRFQNDGRRAEAFVARISYLLG